jgi:hypothetical protein
MSFQQDLLTLFDQFRVKSLDSFDRLPPNEKHYFVTRLYKCFDAGSRKLGQELSSLRGLKLHYSRELNTVNPIQDRMEDTFYKKLAFYTSQSVITCPIEEMSSNAKFSKSKRMEGRERFDSATIHKLRSEGKYVFGDVRADKKTHGGEIHIEGKAYIVDIKALNELLETVLGLREALSHNLVYILPAFPDREKELKTALRKGKVTRGNFAREDLVRQFTERDLQENERYVDAGLTRVYLPHLTNVPINKIIEIREKERDSFIDFQSAIENFVYGSQETASEVKIEEFLKHLDESIRHIRAKISQIKQDWKLTQTEQVIKAVAVSFVAFLPHEIAVAVAPFLGTITAFDYLKSNREYNEKLHAATSGEFYIAWKLSKLGK